MKKETALVVLSGGQDSATCLGIALTSYENVEAISFCYGQKHSIELDCARALCQKYTVSLRVVDISFLSGLVNSELVKADGDLTQQHIDNKDLPSSFVPVRNALFLTIAHGYAQTIKASAIFTGVCQTDYSGYPDCRDAFVRSLQGALNLGYQQKIEIVTPFMNVTKADTFMMAYELGMLEDIVNNTLTCYNGDNTTKHEWGFGCGECPACKIRAKGWAEFQEKLKVKLMVEEANKKILQDIESKKMKSTLLQARIVE